MSDRLKCKDPYGPIPGLEDSNALGPTVLNSSQWEEYLSSNGSVITVSDVITVDSLFYSRRLNRDGGNRITRGCLYEIVLQGDVNDSGLGRKIHGGTSMFLTDLETLDVYSFVCVAVQRRNSNTHVVVMDQDCSAELSNYVKKIGLGGQAYRISHDCEVQSSHEKGSIENGSLSFMVNLVRNDDASLASSHPLRTSSTTGPSQNIWIRTFFEPSKLKQFDRGRSVLLRDPMGVKRSIELRIASDCTRRNQTHDTVSSTSINLSAVKQSDIVTLSMDTKDGAYGTDGTVYVSKTPLDLESTSLGVDYFTGRVIGSTPSTVTVMVTFVPSGASGSGLSWYATTHDPQVNIPVEQSDALAMLTPLELTGYLLETCSSSFRLQVQPDARYASYVFRYKPVFSGEWRYIECGEGSTYIDLVLPNSEYDGQIVGRGETPDGDGEYSPKRRFNTFVTMNI